MTATSNKNFAFSGSDTIRTPQPFSRFISINLFLLNLTSSTDGTCDDRILIIASAAWT